MSEFFDMLKSGQFTFSQVQEFIESQDWEESCEDTEGQTEPPTVEAVSARNFREAAIKLIGECSWDAGGTVVSEDSLKTYAMSEAFALWEPDITSRSGELQPFISEDLKTTFEWDKGPFQYIDWNAYAKREYADQLPEIVWKYSPILEQCKTFYLDENEK